MRLTVLLAAVLALTLLAACGKREGAEEPGQAERFTVLLDWVPNPDHVGLYTAQRAGHFSAVGLDVKLRTPTDPSAPIKQVAEGRADLAISYTPEVLRQRANGLPVVAVAALVQRPLTSIVSLGKVRKPADLEGKEVGTAGIEYQDAYLDAILEQQGIDKDAVERNNVGFNLSQALLTRKVDAVLGAFENIEAVDLRERNRDPHVINVAEAGIPRYDELVLVANEDELEDKGDLIRGFVGAVARGTADAQENPERATGHVLDAARGLDREVTLAQVEATLPTFEPPPGRPFGYLVPGEWERFTRFMVDSGLIDAAPEGAFTNEWLPGEGL